MKWNKIWLCQSFHYQSDISLVILIFLSFFGRVPVTSPVCFLIFFSSEINEQGVCFFQYTVKGKNHCLVLWPHRYFVTKKWECSSHRVIELRKGRSCAAWSPKMLSEEPQKSRSPQGHSALVFFTYWPSNSDDVWRKDSTVWKKTEDLQV